VSESLQHPDRDVWVIVELDANGVRDGTIEALQEGEALSKQLGCHLSAILLGNEVQADAQQLGRRNIAQVYCIEHPQLAPYTTAAWVAALSNLAHTHSPAAIIMSGTPNGQDLAPRLAARLHTAVVNGCVIVRATSPWNIECVVPTHQDKVYTTYTCSTKGQPPIVTLRPGAIGVEPPSGQDQPAITVIHPEIDESETLVQIVEHIPGDPRKMDLRESESIIAGGRGMADASGWAFVQDSADALRASPAGSRKALDMDLLPRDRLIGLSGKSVSPNYYIAAGISGDHYHLQAVQTDHLIAINTDRKAPIFKQSKLGLLGSLHDILPILAAKVRARQGQEKQ
jgi:electron transfer flavoprotein alpha subunit